MENSVENQDRKREGGMKEFTESFTTLSRLNLSGEQEVVLRGAAIRSFADAVASNDPEIAGEIRKSDLVMGERTAPPPGCFNGYAAGWYWSW